MKLSVKSFSLSFGIAFGIYMLFLGWVSAFGWGIRDVTIISNLYIGYGPTFIGGIIGAIWGFVDGAICGYLISTFYNYFFKKFKK
ncbi:MAG: hypothetical protein A3F40_03810 [Chlamydiae bacterium RIFCSPHIGHO2_12_FULL_27_8]|nr:MAG: hypothetical protein A3F40_03810 [Chlamydiae bacterium RIFCSPHIGHO2_12_FULL_27_8]OGN65507.1 MAG: hypothetical protein A2888_01525 [Chlamydiae bacterium RIFCSPLOWO2_01_FULL_28_7]